MVSRLLHDHRGEVRENILCEDVRRVGGREEDPQAVARLDVGAHLDLDGKRVLLALDDLFPRDGPSNDSLVRRLGDHRVHLGPHAGLHLGRAQGEVGRAGVEAVRQVVVEARLFYLFLLKRKGIRVKEIKM